MPSRVYGRKVFSHQNYIRPKKCLVQELFPDLSVDEYVEFDESVQTAAPSFDTRKGYGDRNPNLNALTE